MPRISDAIFFASSGDFASFTPPPLPRPPAWICAFTTTTSVPSSLAAASASSGVLATMPRGTGTPYSFRRAFPWYSWIFIDGTESCGLRNIDDQLQQLPIAAAQNVLVIKQGGPGLGRELALGHQYFQTFFVPYRRG